MSQARIDEATKNLWDYINTLPPDRRELAVAYQQKLEAMAATTPGGMQEVIRQELIHQTALLEETVDELRTIVVEHAADEAIRGIMNKPSPKE